jgi:iron complex outermembrane recepter protein
MRHVISLATVMCVALLPFAAGAQETSNDKVIAELIVTATKREETLQNVPFSVGLQTEQQIRNSGTNNIVDLARNVAGLAIADLGPGQSQVAIRGISSGQVVRDQPGVKESVGVYLDESPISIALFTPDLDLFDLQRMEILRGPQGTLFGAGSSTGTLRYITAQPKLGMFQGAAEVTGTDGTGADTGGSVKGMLNAPIGDKVALRVAAYYDWIPGFIDVKRLDGSVDENVDSGTKSGARVAMLFQPTDALSITPRIVYQKLETDGYPREDFYNILANQFTTTEPAVRLGERQQFVQLQEGLTDEFRLGDLKITYDFGPMTLTSISSYTDRDVEVDRDASQLTGSVTFDILGPTAPSSAVRLNSELIDKTSLQSYSQELRLSSNGNNSAIDWLVGAFYQHTDRDYGQTLPTPGWDAATGIDNTSPGNGGAPADSPFFSRLSYTFKQFAVFGEATYHFTPQWALTGGLRYYDFDEDRVLTFAGAFSAPAANVPGSTSSDGFSPRVILAYAPNDDVTLSAQAARGFRLGGINDPLNAPLCSANDLATFNGHPTWDDETVWNYELGAKMRFAGGTVTFNTAAFYSDIKDLQDGVDVGTCSSRVVLNVPKAHSYGIEAELFARPSLNWDFGLSATWLNAEVDSTIRNAGTGAIVAGIEEGARLPTSPEFQGAASATYRWDWSTNLFSFVNLTYQYVGSSFSRIADEAPNFGLISSDGTLQAAGAARLITFGNPTTPLNIPFDAELPSYDILNLRFVLGSDRWNAAVFCNNVFDEVALLSVDRERGRSARVGYLTNQPRTYGVSLLVNF